MKWTFFLLQRKITGQELLYKVCDDQNLAERDYFGLTYEDHFDPRNWLELDRRVSTLVKSEFKTSIVQSWYTARRFAPRRVRRHLSVTIEDNYPGHSFGEDIDLGSRSRRFFFYFILFFYYY